MSRNRTKAKVAPPVYPREPIGNGELRGADDRLLTRGNVVRNPAHRSESLHATVPSRCGRIIDIYRRNGLELVEVRLDGKDGAAGTAVFLAARVVRSQARIRSEVDAMPEAEKRKRRAA